MANTPQTIPPLSQRIVDPATGFPTKPLADFLFYLSNSGYDDSAIVAEIESILGIQGAQESQITTLLNMVREEAGTRTAALNVLQQQIEEDTLALTRKIDFYKSQLNYVNASITQIQQTQVSDKEASAKETQVLVAENDGRKAEIETETQARIDADSAIATDVTQLQTDLTTLDGTVTSNSTAITGLQTGVTQNTSDIAMAQADATQALADAANAQSTADGKIVSFYQTTAPSTGMSTGDLWFDTDDGNKVYRYSGSAWEAATDTRIATAISAAATAQSTADGKIVSFVQGTAPTAEGTGDVWFDSNDNYKMYRWNGTSWVEVADSRIAANATAITTLQSDVTAIDGTVSGHSSAISTLQTDVSQNTTDITAAQADATQALSNAAAAQSTADSKINAFYQNSEPSLGIELNDLWFDIDDNNKCYRWNGSAWVANDDSRIANAVSAAATAQSTADGKVVTFVQSSQPVAEGTGDLWFDSDDSYKAYRWNGTSWVLIADSRIVTALSDAAQALSDAANAQSTADGKINAFYQDSSPSAEGFGDLWFDTNNGNKCYRWNGSLWVANDDSRIANAVSAAATAQSTADGKIVTFVQAGQPTADGIGDLWYDSDDEYKVYRWNGSVWDLVADSRVATAVTNASQALADAASAQSTADAATSAAQLAQDTADGKITAFYQVSAPTSSMESGDLWFDTNDGNKCYRYTGSAWAAIDDARIATAISAASTAQSTADGKVVTFVQATSPTAEAAGDLWFDSNDNYKMYRWNGTSWVEVTDSRIAANASNITSLTTTVNGHTTTITSHTSSINGVEAKYGVTIDANNNVSGFQLIGGGSTSAFYVSVDDFEIRSPGDTSATFEVEDDKVKINGDLVVNGTIDTTQIADDAVSNVGWVGSSATVEPYNMTPLTVNFDYEGGQLAVFYTATFSTKTASYHQSPSLGVEIDSVIKDRCKAFLFGNTAVGKDTVTRMLLISGLSTGTRTFGLTADNWASGYADIAGRGMLIMELKK